MLVTFVFNNLSDIRPKDRERCLFTLVEQPANVCIGLYDAANDLFLEEDGSENYADEVLYWSKASL